MRYLPVTLFALFLAAGCDNSSQESKAPGISTGHAANVADPDPNDASKDNAGK